MNYPDISFAMWIEIGMKKNFISPPICYTHDGLPTTADEDQEFDSGDPCIHILRLYESEQHKLLVEENHSPAVWRK